ncbi:hypothetical protein C7S18_06040 [Ahniella affigens]|uniref:Uncharacterized protein n=1 Tax=Ahniella affigens TaxID=2021234 RepID=A0A2P1PPL8_9GAMM|nr:hypothetical protein [Ahniella affigens]AVP96785.1 hypothetical protein C7S18_06040 [Ahniella affigens]
MVDEPSLEEMRALLESLMANDPEHPDVSLTHESEWCISVYPSGIVVLENLETGEGPFHMRAVAHDRALELWQSLAAGRISELQLLQWLPGYGA